MSRNRDRKRPPAASTPPPRPPTPVVTRPVGAPPPAIPAIPPQPQFRLTRRDLLVALCLLIAVLAAFGQAVRFPFAELDDYEAVVRNQHLNRGFSLEAVIWAFTETQYFYWQPLTWISHMLDVQMFGLNPLGHHLVNLLFHATNCFLLFLLLHAATSHFWRSVMVAALFAIHPLRVESVVWIVERKDVLSGFFWLLALGAYLRQRRWPTHVFALCAMMSKPMAVTLPITLLLADIWPLGRLREWRHLTGLLIEKAPLLALSALVSAVTFIGTKAEGATLSITQLPLPMRFATALVGYLTYLWKTIWPQSLAVFYPYVVPDGLLVAVSALLLVAGTILALNTIQRHAYFAFGWFWFLITLLPTIGLVQAGGQALADRFSYVPLAGVFVAMVWGLADFSAARAIPRPAVVAIASAVLLALGVRTWVQTSKWKDGVTLFSHAVAVTRDNEPIYRNLGMVLTNRGRFEDAARAFAEGVRIEPLKFVNRYAYGAALQRLGKIPEAIEQLTEAARLQPDYLPAHRDLGQALISQGKLQDAAAEFQYVLSRSPDDAEVRARLAALPPASSDPRTHTHGRPSPPQVAEAPPDPLSRPSAFFTQMELWEIIVLFALLPFAILAPKTGRRHIKWVEVRLAHLAAQPLKCMAVLALTPMLLRLALLAVYPVPQPMVADEFGYLLIADTFANGRLANPPHPMWRFFEANYILQHPSYASIYAFAPGLAMAAAKALTLDPWLGVWAAAGLMCAVIYWMLLAWLPPRWAAVGGFLVVIRFAIIGHWMNSYWGGATAAIGGALLLGALPRVMKTQQLRDVLLLGIGVGLLMQSRPFEGALLAAPVALVLLIWLVRSRTSALKQRLVRVVLPLSVLLAAEFGFTAYYNFRVTGDPLKLPYQLYKEIAGMPQAFFWQKTYEVPPGGFPYKDIEETYRSQSEYHRKWTSLSNFIPLSGAKLKTLWRFYYGPALTIALIALLWLRHSRPVRWLVPILLFALAGITLYPFFFPHYAAPLCAPLVALAVQGLRRLHVIQWRGRRVGLLIVPAVLFANVLNISFIVGEDLLRPGVQQKKNRRTQVIESLAKEGGKHLVMVHYGPNHSYHYGLVYNDADIDASRVVWARDVNPDANQEILRYYANRKAWVFYSDETPARIVPYPQQQFFPTNLPPLE